MQNMMVENKSVDNEFISNIVSIYRKCAGYETFGETTEFYDEDGCVLMTATENGVNRVQFRFAEDGQVFNCLEGMRA
jgi:hypothetical protein